jgi:hypothetical protein
MLHQCPCGGIVRCNGLFDGNGRDHCDSSARAVPRSPNFATGLATTDSLTFPHRQPRARVGANGALRADRSLAAVANTSPPASIRGTFPKPATVRRTPCRSAARAPHERFVDVTPISLRRLRPLQRLVGRRFLSAIASRSGAEPPTWRHRLFHIGVHVLPQRWDRPFHLVACPPCAFPSMASQFSDNPSPPQTQFDQFSRAFRCNKQVPDDDRPTLCRSAASPPHERFVDVTTMSLRRDRPLQRLVRRQDNQSSQFLRPSRPDLTSTPRSDDLSHIGHPDCPSRARIAGLTSAARRECADRRHHLARR